jgi:hypothetical protein
VRVHRKSPPPPPSAPAPLRQDRPAGILHLAPALATRPITVISASTLRASIDNRTDLPTPGGEIPSRWPRQRV